jgi:hypothetical protein
MVNEISAAQDDCEHFNVSSGVYSSMVISAFRSPALAEQFRGWLARPEIQRQFRQWAAGENDVEAGHSGPCALQSGCTCGLLRLHRIPGHETRTEAASAALPGS